MRAQTTAEILGVARAHLAAEGAGSLSLRAIARDLDMGVASLYRYFPSRDDLLTALLVEVFSAQADAVARAVDEVADPAEALRAGLAEYRRWALAHPPEFALAYGTPVPGYVAPSERTTAVAVRVGDILLAQVARAWGQGRIDAGRVARRTDALTPAERAGIEALLTRRGYQVPLGVMSLMVDLFVRIHGYVVMEVFGQLRPLTADPDATFERTVTDALDVLGLAPATRRADR
ncbi:MAG: hypothetical protein QG597_4183 [Actinomycetota bacterium]|nr:hypothetical protein [Actinomycetota bacterium]